MSYYEEDFYYEPSEFDIKMAELRESLLKSVKDEFITEMEKIKAENAELQEVKSNFEAIKKEYENKKRQLEYERSNLVSEVRRERLGKLMEDFQIIMYHPTTKKQQLPKCDKCDKHRKIHYKTPSGKDASESCECAEGKYIYVPGEYICSEFKLDRDKTGLSAFYKKHEERDYDYYNYSSSTYMDAIYKSGMDYEKLEKYKTFFRTEEECQAYCDWLNAKKEE